MLKKFINLSNIRFSIPIYKDNKIVKKCLALNQTNKYRLIKKY
jgi:hypothetical protein